MSQQGQTPNSGDGVVMIMIGIVGLMLFALWYFFQGAIVFNVAKAAYLINKPWTFVPVLSGFANDTAEQSIHAATHAWDTGAWEVLWIFNRANVFYSPFIVAWLVWVAIGAWYHQTRIAKRNHNAQSLLEAIAKFNPTVGPVLWRDLSNDKSPEWLQNRSPVQVCRDAGLVEHRRLDVDGLRDELVSQIGKKHEMGKTFTVPEKAMFAAICAGLLSRLSIDSIAMFDRYNRSCIDRKAEVPDFAALQQVIDEVAAKAWLHPLVQETARDHAYTTTLLMSLLDAVQKRGIVQPSLFLWLKPVQRSLYFALNNGGMKAGRAECAGAWAQRQAEIVAKAHGMRMNRPFVENAIHQFNIELVKIGAINEE